MEDCNLNKKNDKKDIVSDTFKKPNIEQNAQLTNRVKTVDCLNNDTCTSDLNQGVTGYLTDGFDFTLLGILKYIGPLFISQLSTNIMLSIDRIVVMGYSIDAMNAIAMAGSACSLYTALLVPCAAIVSVWVGQYYGAKQYHNIGSVVWQMLYFGIGLFLIFIPLSFCTEYLCAIPIEYRKYGFDYQRIITAFTSLQVIITAFSSFFIGIGNSKISTIVVLTGNLVNFLLNFVFVFGWWGFPSFGPVGTAYSTVVAWILQIAIYSWLFFTPVNIKRFRLLKTKFYPKKLLDYLRTGLPVSIGHMSTLAAWYVIYLILGYTSKDLATLEGFSVTFYLMFFFFTDALNKAAAAMVSNLIGQDRYDLIDRVTRIFFLINVGASILIAIPMLCYPDFLFKLLNLSGENVSHLYSDFVAILKGLWAILLIDGYTYIICGILSAGADTYYILFVNAVTTWIVVFIPIVIMYFTNTLTSIVYVNVLSILNAVICCGIFYFRYKSNCWLKKII